MFYMGVFLTRCLRFYIFMRPKLQLTIEKRYDKLSHFLLLAGNELQGLLQSGHLFPREGRGVFDPRVQPLQLLQGHVSDQARTSGGPVQGGIMDHHLAVEVGP